MTAIEAKELIHQFETCQLPKAKWTHEAHFIMALWYCCHQTLPLAIQSIKDGIKRYNISVGGANTDDSGYHETITVFYTKLIIDYILQGESGHVLRQTATRFFATVISIKRFSPAILYKRIADE